MTNEQLANETKDKLRALKERERKEGPTGQDDRHVLADKALCDFITLLGYGDVVAEYITIEKWFS